MSKSIWKCEMTELIHTLYTNIHITLNTWMFKIHMPHSCVIWFVTKYVKRYFDSQLSECGFFWLKSKLINFFCLLFFTEKLKVQKCAEFNLEYSWIEELRSKLLGQLWESLKRYWYKGYCCFSQLSLTAKQHNGNYWNTCPNYSLSQPTLVN